MNAQHCGASMSKARWWAVSPGNELSLKCMWSQSSTSCHDVPTIDHRTATHVALLLHSMHLSDDAHKQPDLLLFYVISILAGVRHEQHGALHLRATTSIRSDVASIRMPDVHVTSL